MHSGTCGRDRECRVHGRECEAVAAAAIRALRHHGAIVNVSGLEIVLRPAVPVQVTKAA